MSKPNEKEIKAWLRSLPGSMSAWSERDEIMTQAIRRLIEEREEWKKRAMDTLPELLELRQKVRTFEKQAKKGGCR
jgi:predicted  nucleic acid-binding Zn-ribbon protein